MNHSGCTCKRKNVSVRSFLILLSILPALQTSCFYSVNRVNYNPQELQKLESYRTSQQASPIQAPFLKAHMRNGNVYIFSAWRVTLEDSSVEGEGRLLDAYRDIIGEGTFTINADSVVLYETNEIMTAGTNTAITLVSGVSAALTIYCITNPKACFGSCPTFYIYQDDDVHLAAEGFSASISPSLEATDIDALKITASRNEEISLLMKNEALETHVVRLVNLLALPKTHGNRVFRDCHNHFWECCSIIPTKSAEISGGNCLQPLQNEDGIEWFSLADSSDLAAKEIMEITFDRLSTDSLALVLSCRQTLLSTYLLYQSMAYMGNDAGYWLAQCERGLIKQSRNPITKLMGGIEVLVVDDHHRWNVIETISEQGPLATDVHLIPLPPLTDRTIKLRLRMTKGNWRIDWAALTAVKRRIDGIPLPPFQVEKEGISDGFAQHALTDSIQVLTTLPGDEYNLSFRTPGDADEYELFLESRGYYLEWIRDEWLAEENPRHLRQIFLRPEAALKRLAPEFKRVEAEMEDHFWRSRYAKP